MSNKHLAIDFLQLIIKGKIDEAYSKYVNMNGKHHNVFYEDNFSNLKRGMEDNQIKFPKKRFSIKNVIEDSGLVATHSHLSFNSHDTGMIVIHIFRFENNKIVEMWDCGQQIPKDSPNKSGAF